MPGRQHSKLSGEPWALPVTSPFLGLAQTLAASRHMEEMREALCPRRLFGL